MRGAAWLLTLALLAGCAPHTAPPPSQAAPARPRREPPLRVTALLKSDQAAVEAALGTPVLRRPEGGGEVWLYAEATGCSIELTFLGDRAGTMQVSHATYQTPPNLSEAACLRLVADLP